MNGTKDDRGVTYRSIEVLLNTVRSTNTADAHTTITISALEVYNETIRDLLRSDNAASSHAGGLTIRSRRDGVYVEGLSERRVVLLADFARLMDDAAASRATACNGVNETSSRSHLVVRARINTTATLDARTTTTTGHLNLIDLAGSERLKATCAVGDRLKEAQHINRSLSALGDVIAALGNGSRHVPYRNSKLTFLLQDSLRTNTKAFMFVNIDPSPASAAESLCSLNFASRCRAVQLGKASADISSASSSATTGHPLSPVRRKHERAPAASILSSGTKPSILSSGSKQSCCSSSPARTCSF